jgi:pimeloyl-ACP methyl ester carboxylesterase
MPKLKIAESVELYYEEYGSGDDVVLSAHMAITPGDSYQKRLGNAGFHVYSLQLRGFGESTHVFEAPQGGWYPFWAEDVFRFAQTVGANRFIYTGVSHGSGVGWNLALAHPEALHAFVAVVGAPHDRTKPRTRGMGVDGANPPPMFEVPTTDPVRLERRAQRARFMEARAQRLSSPEERAINPGRLFPELDTNEQVAERLSKVKTPLLLLAAAQDDLIPAEMSLLTLKSVQGAKLVMYQDHSHSLAHEAPERLVDEFVLFMEEIRRAPALV